MSASDWLSSAAKALDAEAAAAARARQAVLTKPPGALGELEALAISLAGWQGTALPRVDRVQISVFAADHGVTAEGVSAFPAAVTVEMLRNFARGGAAINVLARALGADLEVVNLGTVEELLLDGVLNVCLARGTANFVYAAAMSESELRGALDAGQASVRRALDRGAQLYIGGEMGIGNTTAAAALACALLSASPKKLVGPGTGLDERGITRKAQVVQRALAYHAGNLGSPLEILRRLGGLEIAALVGAYIRCGQLGLPSLVDGFIASVAALLASHINPSARAWWLFGHESEEPGHAVVLSALQARPILNLRMRLGEGSGAAVAVPVLRLACELHAGMATFVEANVSGKL